MSINRLVQQFRRTAALIAFAGIAVSVQMQAHAQAQDYPSRPIRFVVPDEAGTGVSAIARLLADKLQKKWGQPVIVENKGGGGLNIGADYVAKATPDGYTLLQTPPAPLVVNKALYTKLNYDPDKFEPVSLVSMTPIVLVTTPTLPVENLQELISYAKANPGKLTYASNGSGSNPFLYGELLNSTAGIKTLQVPYKGLAAGMTDIISGQVDMAFIDLGTALQQIKAGRLKVLAIGSDKRNPLLPNTPLVADVFPSFYASTWNGLVAPAGTPHEIILKLSSAVAEAMKDPEIVQALAARSSIAVGSTSEEMDVFLKRERARWKKVIGDTGVKID